MADRARGTWIDPKAGKILFAAWSAEWLKTWTMTWRPRTADKHHMAMRVHWVPRFGGQEVGSITPRQVQAAVDALAAKYQPSSVRSYYGTLRTCFLYAVERDLISRTPCRAIKLPKKSEDEKRVIEPAELHALADAVGEKWRCFIYLGGVMGLRFGEIAALRVSDFDADRRQLLDHSDTDRAQRRTHPVATQEPVERSELCRCHTDGEGTRENISNVRDEMHPIDLIFLNIHGAPVRRSGFRTAVFLPAVESLGLDGLTFHGLRHSAATQWVAERRRPPDGAGLARPRRSAAGPEALRP